MTFFLPRVKLYNALQFIIMRVESNGTRFQMKSILYLILKTFRYKKSEQRMLTF
jgi:hypothetical protein